MGTDPVSVEIGDINGDLLPDLVTANNSANSVSVLFNDPSTPGNFIAAQDFVTGNRPQDIAIGDLNGDGFADLAVADLDLSILLQDPNLPGTFLPRTSLGISSSSVAIGDLNGDLVPDLAVTSVTSETVKLLIQDSVTPGTFLPEVDYPAGDQPIHVAIGDLDADGLADLVVANRGDPSNPVTASISVLLQDPTDPGSFLDADDYGTRPGSKVVAIGDLNANGRPDLAVANRSGEVSVLLQNPVTPGSFKPAVNYKIDSSCLSVAIDDLNRDTLNELVIVDGGVYIMIQNPASSGFFFSPKQVYPPVLDEDFIGVVDERHRLKTGEVTLLNNPNVDLDSILVTDITGTILYIENIDYTVEEVDCFVTISPFVRISRTTVGAIANGQEVLVDYLPAI